MGAGASLVGTLVVASAYVDLSTELVQLSQTIAEDSASAAATVDADEAADAPLDEDEDEDGEEEDAASGDAGTEGAAVTYGTWPAPSRSTRKTAAFPSPTPA